MFWYTKDELIELYEKTLGKNYYGDSYIQYPVMILRKTENMLPFEFSNAGIQSGDRLSVYVNREGIYLENLSGHLIVRAKFDTTLGKEIINCIAFIEKNPAQAFHTLLIYPETLTVKANKLINQFKEVEKIDLSAEEIGLDGMAVKAFLVKATIAIKKDLFGAFSDLSKLAEGADSRMIIIFPNIEPTEYQFYCG